MNYLCTEFWQNLSTPYTLYRDFSVFMRDYMSMLGTVTFLTPEESVEVLLDLEREGNATYTDEEREALKKLPAENEKFMKEYESASDEEEKAKGTYESLEMIDSVGCDKTLRDIHICRRLYRALDNSRKSLSSKLMELLENEISLSAARNYILQQNEKYVAMENRQRAKAESLKSAETVKEMSEGEQILRKLIEPYKGKIILLDIWGVWCAPCRAALSHSQEQYEHFKDYDMVFMYLANRSDEEKWKNIINEYNVTGDNVVHFNLPEAQQSAVENFLKVNAWPSYRLIDQEGNILDINADPRHLEQMTQFIESLQ